MPIRLTRAVKWLLIACFAGFIVQQTIDMYFGGNLLDWLGLVPSAIILKFRFWQLLSYAFLHGDVMHLFLNMMMLAFIGAELEASWGIRRFLSFYFFCSTVAGLLYLILVAVWGRSLDVPMVGASGAIYGLLMAYGLIFEERVMLFMMLFPMKAKHFVWVLAGIEFMSTVYSGPRALSSAAHLGGMAAGFGYLWGWATLVRARKRKSEGGGGRGPRRLKRARKKDNQHLKLVINNDKSLDQGNDGDDFDDNPKTWH